MFVTAVGLAALLRLTGYVTDPWLSAAHIHRITGEPGGAADLRDDARPLTVASWNIERGVNFDKIAETLAALNTDIVLLQEVDRFCRRTGQRDVARDLATSLGMHWVAAGEFQEIGEGGWRDPATTGQAILSRTPITDASTLVFARQSVLRWRLSPVQPRRGGRIALKARTAGALIYNTHLESWAGDALRRHQLHEILADAAAERSGLVLIAGDLNTSLRAHPTVVETLARASFTDALGSGLLRKTSVRHEHSLDWIFVKGAAQAEGRVELLPGVSDHYPLVATIGRPRYPLASTS